MPRRATANEAPRAETSHRRILFVAIALVLWMLAIGARLVQLQIHQHDNLASRARNQQLSSIETAPTRGQVLDRQGRELGKVYLEVDRDRQAFESYEVEQQPGQAVVLTIDQLIQYRTEQALQAAVERSHAKSGTAIVMDPRTGEILALANSPTFNPND